MLPSSAGAWLLHVCKLFACFRKRISSAFAHPGLMPAGFIGLAMQFRERSTVPAGHDSAVINRDSTRRCLRKNEPQGQICGKTEFLDDSNKVPAVTAQSVHVGDGTLGVDTAVEFKVLDACGHVVCVMIRKFGALKPSSSRKRGPSDFSTHVINRGREGL